MEDVGFFLYPKGHYVGQGPSGDTVIVEEIKKDQIEEEVENEIKEEKLGAENTPDLEPLKEFSEEVVDIEINNKEREVPVCPGRTTTFWKRRSETLEKEGVPHLFDNDVHGVWAMF